MLMDLQGVAGNQAVSDLVRVFRTTNSGDAWLRATQLPPAFGLARSTSGASTTASVRIPTNAIARDADPSQTTAVARSTDPALPDNPLAGLEKHDGFKNDPNVATNKPRVKKLQVKLNAKEGAHLGTDGSFGDKTMAVLIEFMQDIGKAPPDIEAVSSGSSGIDQVTADALMDRAPKPEPKPEPPQPTPNQGDPVTQNELLVLTKYQFLQESERDATEDAVRDLKPLDPIAVPFLTSVLEAVGVAAIQFLYGGFEQVLRAAIKSRFPAPSPDKPDKGPSAADITDNAADKASDFLEDFGKDGLKEAIDNEHKKPVQKLEDQLETFRRIQLAGLRKGYFKVQVDWIKEVHSDPKTKDITGDDLQKLAEVLDEKGNDIYKMRYSTVLQAWDSYISQKGGGPSPKQETVVDTNGNAVIDPATGKSQQVSVTSVPKMDDGSTPEKNPGIVFIHIFSSNVKPKLATTKLNPGSNADIFFNGVQVDQGDIHIFGMSETTRQQLVVESPTLASLHLPMVFRGDPVDGGEVAFARDEAGAVRDISSDPKGTLWLRGVGQDLKGKPDPDVGAQALFGSDAGGPVLDLQTIDTGALQGP